ncbi:ABC-F family ATP-binding cassette domain-containing protein [Bacteroidales bacterium OttesenSCG-928-B11]|nr:ABC-F family ATP-binding cassette domain-containing protein [Bacteroidales bacterium OttesenSCG-928-E04]MDL2308175.1 ABC-F family ATP-binding cassette domain-containing protein [Bacteroidales bacterium OttesenSCG-928-C03]MDL2311557.1 ABC-F family ATP-binding cassette domain-containing protein [Bacteroidales bacterium OttesenSCG-928-B11]MDL2325614.1 ABC-F family ATP-binding cassette domain-containing protein [Bacteroidales bacterium OttesenSCG-928-A14]
MNYLSIEKLTKSYGEKLLFDQITFGIEKGQKTALIAKNGTGKSTLLNIIAGLEDPDGGVVVARNDITISYLPQIDNFSEDYSVIDTIFASQLPAIQAIKEYETCLMLMGKATTPALSQRMEKAIETIDRLNAWDIENRAKEILSKFGIHNVFQNVGELSGGQRKKASLAKTLIEQTDLLILDEPTNHLDIDMIEWLEEYLSTSNTTLLMVTHDRYFLDRVCNNIIELENANLYQYKGKYDYYLEKKAERLTNEAAEHEKIKQLYEKELQWVHTSPQARTTKAKARINAFENLKEEASKKSAQKQEAFKVQTERLGNKILEINNIDFAYGDNVLLDDFSYIFKKGEKCGIVGKNGTGKSTFLKLIMKELKPDAGKITPGLTIKFGYFSQDGLDVKGNKRIIDLVKEYSEMIRTEGGNYIGASQFLNHFGFKFEQQYTYYDDLSGGEKRKLHLLITLLQSPNFLILDEPTNDFDIDTLNLLEDFLTHYKGCLLIVSHDRWFMDKLVDHLFVFEGEGKVKDYYGNYTEYRIAKEKDLRVQKKIEKASRLVEEKPRNNSPKSPKLTYKERKELDELELSIAELENEKTEIEAKLSAGLDDAAQLTEITQRYQTVLEALDEQSMRWLELSEKETQGN